MSLHRPQDYENLTLLDLFEENCRATPTRIVYTYVDEKGRERRTLTYSELKLHAYNIARALAIQADVKVGDRVLLVYEPGLDFHIAFWACMVRGAVAVPLAPPNIGQLSQQMGMFTKMAEDCGAKVVLTTFAFATTVLPRASWPQDLLWFVTTEADRLKSAGLRLLDLATVNNIQGLQWLPASEVPKEKYHGKEFIDSHSVAVIQYTSGSTADPRGAMLSHGNLVHNVLIMQEQAVTDENMVFVCWVPHFHDMGLIAGIIHSCVIGATLITLSPSAFVMRPASWLEIITKYKGTATAAPNFAYELAVRKVDAKALESLDLSSLTIAVNGAEPVKHSTMRLFAAKFGQVGFRMQAFYPHYGLAEHCVFLSGPDSSLCRMQPVYIYATRYSLEQEDGEAVEIREESSDETATLVGHGWSHPSVRMIIVHPTTRIICSDLKIGEVWVNSPSCSRGYWNQPEASADVFSAKLADDPDDTPYLRTGDLAFRANNHLFICGRCRDVFIVRGRNIYPHDVESTIQQGCSLVRGGCVAAFLYRRKDVGVKELLTSGEPRQPGQEEMVVVACEVRGLDTSPVVLGNLVDTIFSIVSSSHGIVLHDVVMLPAHSILKTTSGKIKRHAVARAYEVHELPALYSLRLHHRSTLQPVAEISVDQRDTTPVEKPPRVPAQSPSRPRLRLRSMAQDTTNANDVPAGIPRSSEIRQFLVAWVATRMYVGLNDFDVLSTTPFSQLVNSILAVEMCLAVEEWLKIPVPPSLLWEFPTISRLARHLAVQVGGQVDTDDDSESEVSVVTPARTQVSRYVKRRHRFFSETSNTGAAEDKSRRVPSRALFQNIYYRSSRLLPIIFAVSILTNLFVLLIVFFLYARQA